MALELASAVGKAWLEEKGGDQSDERLSKAIDLES
jgi:hypothetical protein